MSVQLGTSLGLDSILKVPITRQNQEWFKNPSQNARTQFISKSFQKSETRCFSLRLKQVINCIT